jgi:predicted nucleic acid-binding protein
MARIFWDTNLFIYLFERNAEWSPRVIEFRQRMVARRRTAHQLPYPRRGTHKAKRDGDSILEKSYLNFFTKGPIELIAFEVEAAKRYAEIRSRERVRPADAIQLACAAAARTDLFVTNDSRLSGVVVSGITFVTGIERVPY